MSVMREAALAYAAAGIPVFPLVGKQPLETAGDINIDGIEIPKGHGGFHQATADIGKVSRWWAEYPDANIGTPTGRHRDAMTGELNTLPFDVLDIDGDLGRQSLDQLTDIHGGIPSSAYQRTGSGGFHYCFASDGAIRNSAGGIAPGIDVRGTGGYIVVAPSIHPETLEPYEWVMPPHAMAQGTETSSYFAPWPDWLKKLIADVARKRNGAQPGQTIPLGQQEATLMRIAGAMRRQGSTASEILAALRVISQERCVPPVKEHDLERMANSAASYAPGDDLLDYPLDDGGNAERLVMRYGAHIRHTADARASTDGWYWYDSRIWQQGPSRIIQMQLETARAYHDAAEGLPDDDRDQARTRTAHIKNAKKMANETGMTSARKVAATFPEIEITRAELDSDPWLFACANGVIDLRTGELRDHHPVDLITRISPVAYEPDAKLGLWEDYLEWVTEGRQELKDFLQLAAGYTMTGDTREERLFFIHGPSQSGKTTLVESLKAMMGDYSLTADFSTFLKGHNVGGPRPDIARLQGTRFVPSIEVDQGKALAEGLVKQMTGGDTITARFLYAGEFEYQASHKLWLVANDAPKVNADDSAMWRRILRIPCEHVVPEGQRDKTLKARLKDPAIGGPAVLAWALAGCRKWQETGLVIPELVKVATEEYRESQDPLTDFIAEACEIRSDAKVEAGDLWMAYTSYCKQYQRRPMGRNQFGDKLEARGYERIRSNGKRFHKGLILQSSDSFK
jgi:putative DNA primase/helicase